MVTLILKAAPVCSIGWKGWRLPFASLPAPPPHSFAFGVCLLHKQVHFSEDEHQSSTGSGLAHRESTPMTNYMWTCNSLPSQQPAFHIYRSHQSHFPPFVSPDSKKYKSTPFNSSPNMPRVWLQMKDEYLSFPYRGRGLQRTRSLASECFALTHTN